MGSERSSVHLGHVQAAGRGRRLETPLHLSLLVCHTGIIIRHFKLRCADVQARRGLHSARPGAWYPEYVASRVSCREVCPIPPYSPSVPVVP